ncbi:retrovirus-related pol polyprotein from transposon TNT 1-94, partial [Tanacetum coccineum]
SSSNPRNQTTVQDGTITIQQVQGRQGQNVVSLGSQGNASGLRGNTSGQAKVFKCYNCQREGHMTRQYTQPKRRRDASWFKEKVLLVQAQAEGKELDEEQLAFLADPGVTNGQVAQTITHNAAFQTNDLDTHNSDCDDISYAKAFRMANISSCDLNVLSEGKEKKSFHQPKAEDTNQKKLYLLHMDLCGPMRVASINGKRYILVIVDDYSRFTWVRFLKTKDEAHAAIIKCIKNIQVCLKATVRDVQTDNGTEFVNQTLREWYENVGITHQTSVAHTPQQNGVVKRRNQSLVEAARTMLIFSKAPLFL